MADESILDAYMVITGTGQHGIQVRGETLDARYGASKYGYNITSFSWEAERKESDDDSSLKKAFSYGSAQLHDFTIKKAIDTATTYLFLNCCVCDTLPTATVSFRKTGAKLGYQVKEVKWNIKGAIPDEKVVFGFQEAKITYYPQDTTGLIGDLPPRIASWSIAKNKPG